jgi:hypothetical protein
MLIALPPETEARLRAKAAREGRDVESVVNALLASGLDLEAAGRPPGTAPNRPPAQANGAPTPIGEAGCAPASGTAIMTPVPLPSLAIHLLGRTRRRAARRGPCVELSFHGAE